MTRILIYIILLLTGTANINAQSQPTRSALAKKSYSARPTVRINSKYCKLIIKSAENNEISITSSYIHNAADDSQAKLTSRLFSSQGIEVNELQNRLDIYVNPSLKSIDSGETSNSKILLLKELTIYIPPSTSLDINSHYGDIVIHQPIEKAIITVSNATLDAADINELTLNGLYCNAHLGNIKNAIIQFNKSSLHAMEIEDMDIDSKNSVIDYSNGKRIYIISWVDEINIQSIDDVDGRSTWGSIGITELKRSLTLQSQKTNIKLRKVSPGAEYININNKHSEMRISLRNIENYSVDFTGKESTTITPFEKKRSTGTVATHLSEADSGKEQPESFTGSRGNLNQQHTRIKVTCDSCIVDFK